MNILVAMPAGEVRDSFIPSDVRAQLEELGTVVWNEDGRSWTEDELAARIAELNAPESKEKPLIWCVGVDTGAYQAVQCRLRRPRTFAGAMGLSGLYDMGRFLGSAEDDLVLRSSPLAALHKNGICDRNVLSRAEENSLLLCVGQGGYEGDALADTQALADTLSEVGFPCHLEVWGGDVSHDWYWWGKEFGMFAERLFG